MNIMRLPFLLAFVAVVAFASAKKHEVIQSGYPITPVPFTSVKIEGGFWGQRLDASREVTIPLAFEKCETERSI